MGMGDKHVADSARPSGLDPCKVAVVLRPRVDDGQDLVTDEVGIGARARS